MIPSPLPDECIDSYLIRCRLLGNRLKTRRNRALGYSIRFDPTFYGTAHRNVWDHGIVGALDEKSKIRLSFLNLALPFLQTSIDRKRQSGSSIFKYRTVPQSFASLLRQELAMCTECTNEDHHQSGYSYWRREAQVSLCILCPKHAIPYVTRCPQCSSDFGNVALPSLTCRSCGFDLNAFEQQMKIEDKQRSAFLRISITVRLMLDGVIKMPLELNRVRARSEQAVRCRTPGHYNNIARYIRMVLGDDYLQAISANPTESPTFGWPAVYLGNEWSDTNPTLELVLFGVFGSEEHIDSFWQGAASNKKKSLSVIPRKLNKRLLKAVYRGKTWSETAELAGENVFSAGVAYGCYPGLKGRAEEFRKRRNNRHRQHT